MDGWSSRARLEIYTFHITSPQGDAHLYKAELLGSQTASASCIKTILEGICQQALPSEQHQLLAHKLSAICSGSASALQQAKEDLSSTYPWIITLPDAPHWLNFYAKDVAKIIPGLDNTINSLALLIRYLNSSNHATALLNEERRRLGLSHGIKSIGDTRVATVYCAAKSVLPSRLLLPPSPGKAAQKHGAGIAIKHSLKGLSFSKSKVTSSVHCSTPAGRAFSNNAQQIKRAQQVSWYYAGYSFQPTEH
ncbi:Ribonuclease H-like domain [Ceraceosorus bombacis]|uniref:Ribonuclease H-like domain n=1 Tax=Ceraceosorus bombacis TaxID=401625 RepID=A0A0N7L355_9BASI|nr:Ribonuclease H-like domain [Ceraceosorus bombacis]